MGNANQGSSRGIISNEIFSDNQSGINNQESSDSSSRVASDQELVPIKPSSALSPSPSYRSRSDQASTSSASDQECLSSSGTGSTPLLPRSTMAAAATSNKLELEHIPLSTTASRPNPPNNLLFHQNNNLPSSNLIVTSSLPPLNNPPITQIVNPVQSRSHPSVTIHDNTKYLSVILLLIRTSYLTVLIIKLFLKFILVPYMFFNKKPYGDINNISLETITIFLWLILIYMTIFVVIAIIGILDDNFFLVLCFLLLMDLEIVVCLYNKYIDTDNTFNIIISGIVLSFTFLYLLLICFEATLTTFVHNRANNDINNNHPDVTVSRNYV